MLGRQFQQKRALGKAVDLVLNKLFITCELSAHCRADMRYTIHVMHHFHAPEYDNAAHFQCPITGDGGSLLGHAIADLVRPEQRIGAVAFGSFTGMEIQAAVLRIIVVVDRCGIRIAVIPVDAEHAALLLAQYIDAFLFRQLLSLSDHQTKHMWTPLVQFIVYSITYGRRFRQAILTQFLHCGIIVPIHVKDGVTYAIQKIR